MSAFETDRSRIIAYQQCPRSRWLGYHAGPEGKGLQRKSKSLPLQFGSAFHEGVGALLSGKGIEDAILTAFLFLTQALNGQTSFDGEDPPDAVYSREEQMALAEALLRGWWAFEGQSFLEQFEVIEVEREGRAVLHEGYIRSHAYNCGMNIGLKCDCLREPEGGLVLMFRPDALVRERASGDLYIVSWKTRAKHDKRSMEQDRHDMQSISEVWGIQQSMELENAVAGEHGDHYWPTKIEGVLYKYALKGSRKKDDWDGLWKQGTHLIYGWKRVSGVLGEEDDWSWRYAWPKEDGVGESRLGKGWKKVPIWREYPGGVKAWIDDLANRRVFPRHLDALSEVFPQSMPVERRGEEVDSWRRQVIAQEERVQTALACVNISKLPLDEHFPQHTHSCHQWSGCQFIPICHEGAAAEPGDLYQIRTANHPETEEEE